jgi:putative membrane protein
MWGSHVTELYELSLQDPAVHVLEHALFLGAACLFWWPLLSPDPLRARLHPAGRAGLLMLQLIPMSFLALALISAGRPLYPSYLGRPEALGIDSMADQGVAAGLMWVTGDGVLLAAGILILARWLQHDEAEARRRESLADARREGRPAP